MRNMKAKRQSRQRGVSKFGLLMLLLAISTFFTVGLKIGPLYIDHNLITGICDELITNGEAANMTITDVRNRVSNGLRINNISGFDLSDIRMTKPNNQPVITIAYERRLELFFNLDIVAKFDTTLQ